MIYKPSIMDEIVGGGEDAQVRIVVQQDCQFCSYTNNELVVLTRGGKNLLALNHNVKM